MRVVVALGGNALLRRGEPMTAENQRHNIHTAAASLAPLVSEHELVITHGNGPQVGLLALQSAAFKAAESYTLDILDAETEGMIGYLIEQELSNLLTPERACATLLTQIEVDRNDAAFMAPSKPIGPVYNEADARRLAAERGWSIAPDGEQFRRVVPSPRPRAILEIGVIELLVDRGVIVICAGGGGIPVVRLDQGGFHGVEAVIDKDLASALLARELGAGALLLLTDVEAVMTDWGEPDARAIRRISPQALAAYSFAPGSMGPKIQAAVEFVERSGGVAGIGKLDDAQAILAGVAGTIVDNSTTDTVWWNQGEN